MTWLADFGKIASIVLSHPDGIEFIRVSQYVVFEEMTAKLREQAVRVIIAANTSPVTYYWLINKITPSRELRLLTDDELQEMTIMLLKSKQWSQLDTQNLLTFE